ncbi:uncharacterized protein CTRU02_211159 [Colletotrichum truncatum]|uniref:Uncharacterized protein n=1 Tax=Colletotrichum truncatum TaxID=5467 RepID=A0ACC3YR04_COLTU|nr:uncharacterized protein CTRU02_01940 [Colletotrichum truncatum]KAF6799069.1 hypothetical protein CTRU02_01940 [Colletotrichum truncatum]
MSAEIHIISKKDISKHETVPVNLSLPPLGPSSIRARSSLISITSNNLSYAKLGDYLQWWSTWPVPLNAPAPYNNQDEWGIVPAWGFGRVRESTIDSIPAGSLLYGCWPTSTHAVDLKLQSHEAKGHFVEVSEHRQGLGNIYNRYNIVDETAKSEEFRAILANAFPIWHAGYLINRFNFPTEFKPVHPLGSSGEWTEKDADLKSAVVVNLSASSRTGRSVAWNFTRNRKPNVNGPLALLNATSSPQTLNHAHKPAVEVKSVNYDNLVDKETMDWIANFKPNRVVVLDNGGPAETTERFRELLVDSLPASTALTLVMVGNVPKIESLEEFQASMALKARWGHTAQLNTTDVADAAIAAEGADAFCQGVEGAFERAVAENYLGDIGLVWGSGVGGQAGIEKAWENLIKGTLSPTKAWVYQLEN